MCARACVLGIITVSRLLLRVCVCVCWELLLSFTCCCLLFSLFFLLTFWPHLTGCRISVPRPGIEPHPLTTRLSEVPRAVFSAVSPIAWLAGSHQISPKLCSPGLPQAVSPASASGLPFTPASWNDGAGPPCYNHSFMSVSS